MKFKVLNIIVSDNSHNYFTFHSVYKLSGERSLYIKHSPFIHTLSLRVYRKC